MMQCIQKHRWAYGYIILEFIMERKPQQHNISIANAGTHKRGKWLSSGLGSKALDIWQSSTWNCQMLTFTFRVGGRKFQIIANINISGFGQLCPLVLTVEETLAFKTKLSPWCNWYHMCLSLVSWKNQSLAQGVPCWWFILGIDPKAQKWGSGMSETEEGTSINPSWSPLSVSNWNLTHLGSFWRAVNNVSVIGQQGVEEGSTYVLASIFLWWKLSPWAVNTLLLPLWALS